MLKETQYDWRSGIRVECLIVCLMSPFIWLVIHDWTDSILIGHYILTLSVVFLLQSLFRDLWILYTQRKANNLAGKSADFSKPKVKKPVFCIESVVGLSGVVMGCAIILMNTSQQYITLDKFSWVISIGLTMLFCFLLKDWVLSWRPWKIYRDENHVNIIVGWK